MGMIVIILRATEEGWKHCMQRDYFCKNFLIMKRWLSG